MTIRLSHKPADASPAVLPQVAGPEHVSILIRTLGRPTLSQAVLSALAQTWPGLSVKLVLAHGEPLVAQCEALRDPRVTVINSGQALPRAAAANRALAAADTELALFLDDDDWLLPDHVARLVLALRAHPQAVAAYADVECRQGSDGAVHIFDGAMSAAAMQLNNRLPIHSTLFRTSLALRDPAARFDEGLEQFEDWDFWLQLLARGPFVHVPGVSAIYRLDDQAGSGHAAPASALRRRMLERFGARQLLRWAPADVADMVEYGATQVQAARQAQQALVFQRQAVAQLQDTQALLQTEMARAREGADLLLADRARWQEASARWQAASAAAQSQVRILEGLVETTDQQLASAHTALQTTLAEGDVLRQSLAEHRAEVDHLGSVRTEHLRQIELLNQRTAAIYASTSWRITRPLRWAGKAARLLSSGRWRTLLANTGHALQSELRRRGALGVLMRLPHYLAHAKRFARLLAAPPPVHVQPFAAGPYKPPATLRLHPELRGTDECLDFKISVVIPTLNGGTELAALMRKLKDQRAVREVELVIVDSGSTDNTVALAQAAGARVIEIPPSAFSHSHARNLGADAAQGDYLVFMVQDASPIGGLWLYGMLRWLLDHQGQGVVAASCSEYCRSDSDLMYDCMVQTHYRFLGCLDIDRIGYFTGDDHMSLRSMGQLSDVACLIGRQTFAQFRYRGDYAEDLDLGIRLIQAGHKVAMLASVKVIHSHNRPAHYYLKRSFVDVIFLVGLFKDFYHPPCKSVAGLMEGIRATGASVGAWLAAIEGAPQAFSLDALAPRNFVQVRGSGMSPGIGDAKVDSFVAELMHSVAALATASGADELFKAEAQQFHDSFIARLDHFHQYVKSVYGPCDERLRHETLAAVRKIFASTLGSALAYVYLDRQALPADHPERHWIAGIFATLKAGI